MSASVIPTSELPSGVYSLSEAAREAEELGRVEDDFIHAWARLAKAFGMDTTMGRVHAVIYLSPSAIDADAVSARLGLPLAVVELHLTTLVEWQLVYRSGSGFVAEQDPWTWFGKTIRARQRREFLPVRNAVESVRCAARALVAASPSSESARALVARIERFAGFVADFSKLIDAFVTLGAAPMLKFVSMTTRLVPRRAA